MIVSHFDVARFSDGPNRLYRLLITNLASKRYYFRLTWRTRTDSFRPFDENWWTVREKNPYDPSPVIPIQKQAWDTYVDKYLLELHPLLNVSVTLSPHSKTVTHRAIGYLDLSLPMTLDEDTFTKLIPQSDKPVPVLLHASSVSRQLLAYPEESGERLPTAIPLSTGQALNEIMPQQAIRISPQMILAPPTEGAPTEAPAEGQKRDYAAMLEDPTSASALVAYLGVAGQSPEAVEALNTLLQRGGHPVRLQSDG